MNWRLRLLMGAVLGLWTIVVVRLFVLQVWQHDDARLRAERQQKYVEPIPARHGDILDRHGRLLATTMKVPSCFVDPSRISEPDDIAGILSQALNLDAEELAREIAANRPRRFLWIKRRISEEEAQRVLALELPAGVCGLRDELQRQYPHGHLAAHVLGWRNIDGAGQSGVERSLEEILSGEDGRRLLVRDSRGFVLEILDEVTQPPVHGRAVRLSIELELQAFAERELDGIVGRWQPRGASVIVLDPRNGEVLAMASRPTFDPNLPAKSPTDAWTNGAVHLASEPGSTLKPIIAAWGLQTGAIARDDVFDCGNGTYQMSSRTLHDTHPYGVLDVAGILVKSSNIGMARIGERMGNERLFAAVRKFGFGRRTGIELPGESAGIVRPAEQWDRYSIGSIPMGQEIAVTPLQLIRAHAAIASGGRLITPHLVHADASESAAPANVLEMRIISPAVARWMIEEPLSEVVVSGTGRRAQLEGVKVFAKTGTAQVYDAGAGEYVDGRYVSSCVCGAPANAPRVLVLVTVNEPESEDDPYGGIVAAPAAVAILEKALAVESTPGPMSGGAAQSR